MIKPLAIMKQATIQNIMIHILMIITQSDLPRDIRGMESGY